MTIAQVTGVGYKVGSQTIFPTCASAVGYKGNADTEAIDFIADKVEVRSQEDISFLAIPTGAPLGFLWDFGNGETSTERDPVFAFAGSGTFTVTLTMTSVDSNPVETKVDYITVLPDPTVFTDLGNIPSKEITDLGDIPQNTVVEAIVVLNANLDIEVST